MAERWWPPRPSRVWARLLGRLLAVLAPCSPTDAGVVAGPVGDDTGALGEAERPATAAPTTDRARGPPRTNVDTAIGVTRREAPDMPITSHQTDGEHPQSLFHPGFH
jgi:hypothetical protein